MEQFMAGKLARSIVCHVYRVEESVRDVADVVLTLQGEHSTALSRPDA